MNEPNETIEISGPDNGRWHFTQISDWIALNPDLKDGAFRLYVILRSLIIEKQDDHIRKLTHDEIAYMMVGKNGKPSTVSTVKALLRNLEEVGLIEHPDGTRMASPTGRGNPTAELRYRLIDWPDKKSHTGWRNAFDKLDWHSEDWAETRSDVAGDDYAAWLAGEQKTTPPRRARKQGEQKASPKAKENTRHRRSFFSQDSPATSDDAPSNKPSQEAPGISSSSSAEVEDVTHEATPPAPKKKTSKPQDREQAKTLIGEHFPDSADDEREAIIDLVYAEAAAKGRKIGFIASYVSGRPDALLEQDLAQVRRHSAAPTATECGDHHQAMPAYGCPLCAGEIKAGDPEDIARLRAHLALVGEKARPDLARLLGAPQTPVDNVRSLDEGERIRRMQRRHSGVVGGSRTPLPPHSEYQRLTGMTSDQIGAEML